MIGACLLTLALLQHPIHDLGPKQHPFPGNVDIHAFTWSPAPNSEWCNVYAASHEQPWVFYDMVPASNPRWIFDARNDMPGGLQFIVVTCFNRYGESVTDHGDFPGAVTYE